MRRATPLRDGPGQAPALTLHFDGAPVPADPRDTVASALIAAGELMTSRSAKYRRPRGAYCLLGDCGTCLVRVDGEPNVRACLTPVRDGMQVSSQNSYGDLDPTALIDAVFPGGIDHHHLVVRPRLANSVMQGVARNLTGFGILPDHAPAGPAWREEHVPEVLVVGAGRSGRVAAARLLAAGLDVLLLDRRDRADLLAWDPAPLPAALRPGLGVFAAYPHEGLWAAAAAIADEGPNQHPNQASQRARRRPHPPHHPPAPRHPRPRRPPAHDPRHRQRHPRRRLGPRPASPARKDRSRSGRPRRRDRRRSGRPGPRRRPRRGPRRPRRGPPHRRPPPRQGRRDRHRPPPRPPRRPRPRARPRLRARRPGRRRPALDRQRLRPDLRPGRPRPAARRGAPARRRPAREPTLDPVGHRRPEPARRRRGRRRRPPAPARTSCPKGQP
ncbi:MAG: (2Fe-2S)-binding protein [Nannocystis sp.]|nr:(2Fe-2S)-binding protein [Nannocystis sp.]